MTGSVLRAALAGQVFVPGPATITVTGSTERSTAEDETWWQLWRKRGLIIGLATVVAAVVAGLQLFGWVPWKHADPPGQHPSGHAAHSAAAVQASAGQQTYLVTAVPILRALDMHHPGGCLRTVVPSSDTPRC